MNADDKNWPRREDSPSKQAIERTSTLIKAAALLGAKYSPGRIDLPCGRVVILRWTDTSCNIWPVWFPDDFHTVEEICPTSIAVAIRKMLVEHDEYLLTNPQ